MLEEEELTRDGMVNELKEITIILNDVNGRILLSTLVMVATLVSIAMNRIHVFL